MTDDELNEIESRIGVVSITPHDVIDHAREDIPALIAEVRQLRAERDAIINLLEKYDHCPDNFYLCPHKECCNGDKSCWLIWARNEVRKAKES